MPEAKRLYFSEKYKQELVNLFKAFIALTREMHIKQLEIPLVGAAVPPPTITIYPQVSTEPITTYYYCRAQSYRFVRELLETTFG